MRFSFAALVDYWRARLLRIESLLARRPHFAWSLRLERRVISYCLHRYSDGPNASPPAEAAPLDAAGAERARQLWIRGKSEPAQAPSTDADPADSNPADDADDKPHPPVPYLAIAAALFVMTGITILASFCNLGKVGNVILAMALAATKASLVMLFFMHLKYEKRTLLLIALIPYLLAAILCLALFPDIVFGQHH